MALGWMGCLVCAILCSVWCAVSAMCSVKCYVKCMVCSKCNVQCKMLWVLCVEGNVHCRVFGVQWSPHSAVWNNRTLLNFLLIQLILCQQSGGTKNSMFDVVHSYKLFNICYLLLADGWCGHKQPPEFKCIEDFSLKLVSVLFFWSVINSKKFEFFSWILSAIIYSY